MRQAFAVLALATCHSTATPRTKAASSSPEPAQTSSQRNANVRTTTPRIVRASEGGAVKIEDGAPHSIRTVDVGGGVGIEVLDWGGAGPAIVLLAGLGNSAHIFDDFASAFIGRSRVLGLSRRGFGGSTAPERGYDITSLGGDILRALDAFAISRAIFIGHSIAGEELTWLGAEHPDRVLALIYLDAAYDRVALRTHRPASTTEPPPKPADLASPTGYAEHMARGMGMPIPLDEVLAGFKFDSDGRFIGPATSPSVVQQIAAAVRVPDYSRISAPTLAVYALADHWTTDYASFTATERARFSHALPSARVEAIPHSKHYLFLTNRAEVLRELGSFLAGLQLRSDDVRSE